MFLKPLFGLCLAFALSSNAVAKSRSKKSAADETKQSSLKLQASPHSLLIGGGLLSAWLPLIGIEGFYRYKRLFDIGAGVGLMSFNHPEFGYSSLQINIEGRWFLTKAIFGGVTMGQRTITIKDPQKVNVTIANDDGEINRSEAELLWTAKANQMILSPKIGWFYQGKSPWGIDLGVGLSIPLNKNLNLNHQPEALSGVTAEFIDEEKQKEREKIVKYTDSIAPLVEVKAYWILTP